MYKREICTKDNFHLQALLIQKDGPDFGRSRETRPRWAERGALRDNTTVNTVAEESHLGKTRQDIGDGEDDNKTERDLGQGIPRDVEIVEIHEVEEEKISNVEGSPLQE